MEGEGLLGRMASVDEFCWELLGLGKLGRNTIFCVLSTFLHHLLP